ncbi:MAG TPA: hypothetical protein VKA74_12660, partial [Myxococcota bacterium]|nr:hypothetical protein [Myxococcota bacterium]
MLWLSAGQADAQLVPGTCPSSLATEEIIAHDFTVSFCELCETGRIELEITNPFRQSDDVDLTELVITENLGSSGLTYLPGSTRFSGQNVTPPGAIEPTVSGPAGSILRWDLSPSDFVLAARTGGGGNQETLVLEFEVVRDASVGEEGLVLANRTIE